MPVEFRILPDRNLVVVTFSGHVGIDETMRSAESYGRHPDFRPGQTHLFDTSAVTGFEQDFGKIFQMQANLLDVLGAAPSEQLFVFYAPTPAGQRMGVLARGSWDAHPNVVVRILEDEQAVLELAGQREMTLKALLAQAA